MVEPILSERGVNQSIPRQVAYDVVKRLAVHAKHLSELALLDESFGSVRAPNFSTSIALARCNRDLTVPTAQLSAAAVST
jgi:hypothetical protein